MEVQTIKIIRVYISCVKINTILYQQPLTARVRTLSNSVEYDVISLAVLSEIFSGVI